MKIDIHMAPEANRREASESRWQRAKNINTEVRILEYELELEQVAEGQELIVIYRKASQDLKIFIVENLEEQEKNLSGLKKKIRQEEVEAEEELRRETEKERKEENERMRMMLSEKEEEVKEMKRRLTEMQEGSIRRRRDPSENGVRCRRCGIIGHIERFCKSSLGQRNKDEGYESKRLNKENFNYKCKVQAKSKKYKRMLEEESSSKKEMEIEENERSWKRKSRFNEVQDLEKEFPSVFTELERPIEDNDLEECKIETKEGEVVVKKGQMVPMALREKTKAYIEELVKRDVLDYSNSEWRNPMRALMKPNGEVRVVMNLISLNDLVRKDPYELPNIRDIVRSVAGSKFLTVLDLKEGFYNIKIRKKDRAKTAFEYDGKIYEWKRMVMGYKNSPQLMQRQMTKVLEGLIGQGVQVYIDDILIHAENEEKHDELVREVSRRLEYTRMRVNPNKVQFKKREVNVLGVTVNGERQLPAEIKKNEALEYERPKTVKELRRFLGLTGWFRNFIKDYARSSIYLTDALKTKNKKLEWTDEMEKEFQEMKRKLREMGELKLPDYKKGFLLRTDASNVGLGAVLLQQEENGEWRPIQWASKKLTPAESRYGISEKEMLAVFWGIKKFEYELRGRRFKLETDHRALEEIRRRPYFENNRINRWIEAIQEYDFTVSYKKGEEMVDPDALSRQFENDKKKERGEKIKEGKRKVHEIERDGKKFWRFDHGEEREIPDESIRTEMIKQVHEVLQHRGYKAVMYRIRKTHYWPGMKDTIREELKKCEVCLINNRKKSGGSDFVTTNEPLEKLAVDVLDLKSEEGIYVLIGIDYFTRGIAVKIVKSKAAQEISDGMREWFMAGIIPKEIISDNGKEFCNEKVDELCRDFNVGHRAVSVESHRSNGRVERVIETLREGLVKNKGTRKSISDRLREIVEAYNETYHSAIKCTPAEAWGENKEKARIENSKEGSYNKQFKKGYREEFTEQQKVRIAKRENLKNRTKQDKGRFLMKGEVLAKCKGDSYIIRNVETGKISKKRHYDLKGEISNKLSNETTRLEGGMLVSPIYD